MVHCVAGNGDTEATIFDRPTDTVVSAQATAWTDPSGFTIGHDADGRTGGFDITADWMLSGTLTTNSTFDRPGTGFQVKIADLDVPGTVIPLPAGLPLLIAGLGALGAFRLSRRG